MSQFESTEWLQRGIEANFARQLASEIFDTLSTWPETYESTRELRNQWRLNFAEAGWVISPSIGDSSLTISYLREKLGVCVQLGNVSRVYADLLKLRTLFVSKKITHGVIIVPSNEFSKALGSNHANFLRLERDLDVMYEAIAIPLLVLAVNGP